MNNQTVMIERRKHPRAGAIKQIEDITYTILRNYGISDRAQHAGGEQELP